jgi:hypothetical protein
MSKRTHKPQLIRAELHTHSTASDGQHDPGVLAELCARRGVRVLSLTDHDSVAGVASARAVCSARGVGFLSGIEVSAQRGRSVHVLGYGVDTEDEVFLSLLSTRRDQRERRMELMIARANDLGMPVSYEDVLAFAGDGNPGRPHLARALVAAGFARSIQDAFDRFLADGKPVHVRNPWPSVPEAIREIKAAGGVAVLAHPGLYGMDEHLDDWADAGLDGIEVSHPSHDEAARARYLRFATRRGLLPTASSDYHGPEVKQGQVLGEVFVRQDWVDALLERCA